MNLQSVPFLLPIEFDLAATFLLALTGVWAASRRGYDLVGAVLLAFATAVGGGLMRDSLLIGHVPVVMQDMRYLVAVLAAVVAGTLLQRAEQRFIHLFAYIDAAAIGIYGVVGANKALIDGIAPLPALVVGLCNAVGGGLIRDVLIREEPLVLKPGQLYVLAALAGCTTFVILSAVYALDTNRAAWIAILITFALRLAAIRFNWTTRSLAEWRRRFDRS